MPRPSPVFCTAIQQEADWPSASAGNRTGSRLTFQGSQGTSEIPAWKPDGLSRPDPTDTCQFQPMLVEKASILMDMLGKTVHASDHDTEGRHYLTGVYLHVPEKQNRLVAVATDGRRLALASAPLSESTTEEPDLILPNHQVRILVNQMDSEEEITLDGDRQRIRFTGKDHSIILSSIEGTYPDYPKVIPSGGRITFHLDTSSLKQSLKRLAAISGDEIKIRLAGDPKGLSVSFDSPRTGARDPVPGCHASKKSEISLNRVYLQDILETVGQETLILKVIDGQSPCIAQEEQDGIQYSFVVMPYRS